jgi:hypothetical protein
MTSGSIDSWRNEPGRWSHRLIKNRRKEGSLRRSKSVDESTKEPLEKLQVIDEVQDEVHDDGYVEAETSQEPSIDENQVKNHIKKQLKKLLNHNLLKVRIGKQFKKIVSFL